MIQKSMEIQRKYSDSLHSIVRFPQISSEILRYPQVFRGIPQVREVVLSLDFLRDPQISSGFLCISLGFVRYFYHQISLDILRDPQISLDILRFFMDFLRFSEVVLSLDILRYPQIRCPEEILQDKTACLKSNTLRTPTNFNNKVPPQPPTSMLTCGIYFVRLVRRLGGV